MRSVVVVLPASMCAMMPMLRTLVRSVSTSFCATEVFPLFRLLGCCPFPLLLEPSINNALGDRFLPLHQNFVHQLGDQLRPVDGVVDQRTLGRGPLAWH